MAGKIQHFIWNDKNKAVKQHFDIQIFHLRIIYLDITEI